MNGYMVACRGCNKKTGPYSTYPERCEYCGSKFIVVRPHPESDRDIKLESEDGK